MDKKTNMDYWAGVLNDAPISYKEWFAKEKEYLQKRITTDSMVLEVGCGDGRSIWDILPCTNHIVGIDHNDEIVIEAQKKFIDYPIVKIVKADASNLPFPERTFDFVVCMTTFANFADKKYAILEEMKRVLKKDGKIIISVFSEEALEERMKIYKSCGVKIKEIKGGTVIFDESLGDNISEQFSKEDLEAIFLKVNLEIEDITKIGIAYLCTLYLKN